MCVVLVGWVESAERVEDDKVLIGEIRDCTGTIPFRYEIRADLGLKYKNELVGVLLGEKENAIEHATIYRIIGNPQHIDGELCLM